MRSDSHTGLLHPAESLLDRVETPGAFAHLISSRQPPEIAIMDK